MLGGHPAVYEGSPRCGQRRRGTAEKFSEPSQILRDCRQQHFIPDAVQASQPQPVEPEDAFHVGEPHLDLLALATRLLERLRIGQRADAIAHILVEVAGNFTDDRRRAPRLQGTARAVLLAL